VRLCAKRPQLRIVEEELSAWRNAPSSLTISTRMASIEVVISQAL